ncbi:MAG TPA: DUF4136 domain-containing protein [Candidatus Dormibacteraeota bacterium]|nr:DUF4136 domain-containing protein [Candidatus Dormibacteraeota bacterium]
MDTGRRDKGRRRGRDVLRPSSLCLPSVAFALLLAGCAAKIPVHVDAASRTTLAGYRTYAWTAPPPDPKAPSRDPALQVFDWHLQTTAENALAGKGYIRNDNAPDMLVVLRTDVDEKYSETIGDYFHYRDAGGTQPLFNAYSLGYEEATITIEAYDAASRVLIWRGRTAVAMDAPHRDRRAVDSVSELLKTFPIQQG